MTALLSERCLTLLAILIAAAALMATTFSAEYQALGAAQSPVFFPRIILGVMMVLCAIATLQDLRAGTRAGSVEHVIALIVFVLAALLFANAITRIGFMLSGAAFSAVSLWIFGIRHPLAILAYALAVPGAIVLLFNHILALPLPTAPFTHLF
ncbi:MAG: tripartite tricarboxylate transporter TctB family protein [Pseudomonadota bacterium]